eukprot:symbB.v1.2.004625.t1/scaffold255.1/size249928/15
MEAACQELEKESARQKDLVQQQQEEFRQLKNKVEQCKAQLPSEGKHDLEAYKAPEATEKVKEKGLGETTELPNKKLPHQHKLPYFSAMVSHDSLVRAEKRLGVPAVIGRFHKAPRQLQDDYELDDKVLGTGCSGQVMQATNLATGAKAAVKNLSLVGITDKAKKELENEVELFLSMDHPRVARLLDVYESEGRLSLVMECMEGGELFTRVMDRE